MLPEVKSIIRSTTYNFARKVAARAMRMRSGQEVRRYLEGVFKEKFPDISASEMIG